MSILENTLAPLKIIKQIIYSWDGILILNHDLVQLPIINIHFKRTIIISNKEHWSTQWINTWPNETLIQVVV